MRYAEIYWVIDGMMDLLKFWVCIWLCEVFHFLNFFQFFLFPYLFDQSLPEL